MVLPRQAVPAIAADTMRIFYNLIQLLGAPLLLALLALMLLRRPGRAASLLARFGWGLKPTPRRSGGPTATLWIHALSVGEVTSALPLLRALKTHEPSVTVVFSATTTSGLTLAGEKARPWIDALIPFPFDIVPVVTHFLNRVQPDLFILIETDFWPNLMAQLARRQIPALLFNGRISARSMRSYQRFSFFFRPLFDRFEELCMQTATDTDNMIRLGIAASKVKTIGNLKYADALSDLPVKGSCGVPATAGQLVVLCGSTHRGEEIVIVSAYARLLDRHRHLRLAIAPRHIDRCGEIAAIAERLGLATSLFSDGQPEPGGILIIDTMGDLAALYRCADIAFVGGSLVAEGGHNPLEAAQQGLPIVFGPHMDDFAEISRELLECGAAFEAENQSALESILERLIASAHARATAGRQARHCIERYHDVINTHLAVIRRYL